jgi:hypothetical protein
MTTITTTQRSSPPASTRPTVGELVEDTLPLVDTVFVAGPPVLLVWAGTVLFALMLAGPFALAVTLALALAAAAAAVTLAGAVLAAPYLLIRHFGPRLAKRRHVSEGWAPIATVVARAKRATTRPAIAALAQSTTARGSR